MLEILALQWMVVGSCTHTLHGLAAFLQNVERQNLRQSNKSRTIGLSDREQSHDQNQSQVIFEDVKKPDAAIRYRRQSHTSLKQVLRYLHDQSLAVATAKNLPWGVYIG